MVHPIHSFTIIQNGALQPYTTALVMYFTHVQGQTASNWHSQNFNLGRSYHKAYVQCEPSHSTAETFHFSEPDLDGGFSDTLLALKQCSGFSQVILILFLSTKLGHGLFLVPIVFFCPSALLLLFWFPLQNISMGSILCNSLLCS